MSSTPITWPQGFIDRLIERTAAIQDAEKFHPRLTPEQVEALIHLLAKAPTGKGQCMRKRAPDSLGGGVGPSGAFLT
jgi:hypothetical protein